jgi:SAM-dependent methyltransferase
MDYDKTTIAATYDAARGYRPEVLRHWLDLIAAYVPAQPSLIVDVGCGTGRFTHPLAERFGARVIGIDPSERMLQAARVKVSGGRVEFRRAPAERLPLEDGCADLVFMSMVLHHLPDVPAAARECRRVLRQGGRLCIRNATRDLTYPQARFFPGIAPMLDAELPSVEDVEQLFEGEGFTRLAHRLVTHALARDWQGFADKMALRADSFLARLPDTEFEAGLTALRAHAAGSEPEEITELVDFFVFER